MWVKRNTLERKLADAMGYEYCTLFDTARNALRALAFETWWPLPIPSNICPALGREVPRAQLWPVHPETGLAEYLPVQLYGYRCRGDGYRLDLDPLMTGFLRRPIAEKSIISFGPKKMLDAGGGGALLSNKGFKGKPFFPECLRERIEDKLKWFARDIERRRDQIETWNRYLGDSCIRIPREQIMPWRVMRRIPEKRDAVVKALRDAGHPVGTNYPPLPGVTDLGAINWGLEVINFFPDWPDVEGACEIIKRTLAQ